MKIGLKWNSFIIDLYPVPPQSPLSKHKLHKVNPPRLGILTSLWGLLSAGVGHGFASDVLSFPQALIYEKYRNIFRLLFISLSDMAKLSKDILKVFRCLSCEAILYACFLQET